MRPRALLPLIALVVTACARQVYTAPSTTATRAAATRRAPIPSLPPLSSSETVNYLLARGLEVPVAGFTVAQLRDTFDEGRNGGRVHRALDLLAARGTPVIAADSGRVLRVRANALGGNTIYATDPLGRVVYYYAHLDAYRPGLAEGAMIARGDTLGVVGTTGNAPRNTPHLHFQVMRMPADGKYWDGDPINPYPLLLLMHAARP
jgi:murein DD-endopeptidase MepM/ murein hydrolase activator NlpD